MKHDLSLQTKTASPQQQEHSATHGSALHAHTATRKTYKPLHLPIMRILSYVVVLFFAFLYIFPIGYMLNVSLQSASDFLVNPSSLTKSLNFGNYLNAWDQGNFGAYIYNSVVYTGISTLASTALSLLFAFPIARGYVKWSKLWYSFLVVTMFLPSGLVPQFQLLLSLNLYNTQLGYILLKTATLGLGPFLIVGYLKAIPRELDEAAAIDGCGYFRYIWSIIVPLTKPILITVIILHAIGVWNDIIGPVIYLADKEYYPVTQGLFAFYGQFSNDWVTLSAATMIVALPLIVFYLLLQRYFIDGAMSGAFKS